MIKKLLLIFLFFTIACPAQNKIKGSRNVSTEKTRLNSFHSIEISGEFEVGIKNGRNNQLEVKADDNLHEYIESEIKNGTLYIKAKKEFNRTKSLEIEITYTDTLRFISISDKVELASLEDLKVNEFQLETRDDSKAFITLKANSFNLINLDGAKNELNVTANETYFQLNGNSNVEALVNSPIFRVEILDKAGAQIEGDIEEFDLKANGNSNFQGDNLTCIKAIVVAAEKSDVEVNAKETLELSAKDNSKVEIYNNPQIKLIQFTEEAVISKKEFKKGLFQ
ncbi:DUF2807 domain-containing protein [Gramella sp. AN32]|uniref:GIN domain-containing protein n=1 Tax=Christiangramia antarctica TaxID=2058158 RepID=A0ABW5XC07_9FLAO|nr:DUF2807 domain-containing protein [Gramella sp. AN32]MCM4156596.1 hypothetical protein [Gramella sp. AN32]